MPTCYSAGLWWHINGACHQRKVTSGMSNQVVGKSLKKKKKWTGNSINEIRANVLTEHLPLSTARSQADWIWDPRSSQKWGHCFTLSPCTAVSRGSASPAHPFHLPRCSCLLGFLREKPTLTRLRRHLTWFWEWPYLGCLPALISSAALGKISHPNLCSLIS